jgi:hypothetical protein
MTTVGVEARAEVLCKRVEINHWGCGVLESCGVEDGMREEQEL